MKLNWKEDLKKESSTRLFEIFSEKNRINIEPQIFAGNLLFERKYDLKKLKTSKNELIQSIEDAFKKKQNTEPDKIKKENTIREISLRILLAAAIWGVFYNSHPITFNFLSINIDNKIIAVTLIFINFLPLFWLKKSNTKAIRKVEKEIEKKSSLIKKIEIELKF